jgi:FtsZ-binding cell division protein ZapB
MHNTSNDDLPSITQEYLDFLTARIQQVTADYLELEKEKQALLSQPQPSQEQLRSLLLQLENHNELLSNLQVQVSQAIEDLRNWQKQP